MEKLKKEHLNIRKKILQFKEFSVYDVATKFAEKNQEGEFYRIYRNVERVVRDLINEGKVKFLRYESSRSPSKMKRIYKNLA